MPTNTSTTPKTKQKKRREEMLNVLQRSSQMTQYLLATSYDRKSGFQRNQEILLYSKKAGVYVWQFELNANGGKLPAKNEDENFPVFEDLPCAMEYFASHMDDENQGVQFELFAFRK